MLGEKTIINKIILTFFAALPLFAQPDYWPLQLGHQWVLRAESRFLDTQVVEVTGKSSVAGREYFQMRFFGRDLLVRTVANGDMMVWDDRSNSESILIAFSAGVGSTFRTSIDPCTGTGRIDSNSATHKGPAASFSNVLAVSFLSVCADAGFAQMSFAPGTGPVYIEAGNIAGALRYELIYARTGATVLSAPESAFGLSLDSPVYAFVPPGTAGGGPQFALARMTLRNTHAEPVEITFASGQTYELLLKNIRGEIVWRWSEGKAFTQALRNERFGPGEKNWAETIPLNGVPAGKYMVEAFLVTVGERQYVASIGIEIRAAR